MGWYRAAARWRRAVGAPARALASRSLNKSALALEFVCPRASSGKATATADSSSAARGRHLMIHQTQDRLERAPSGLWRGALDTPQARKLGLTLANLAAPEPIYIAECRGLRLTTGLTDGRAKPLPQTGCVLRCVRGRWNPNGRGRTRAAQDLAEFGSHSSRERSAQLSEMTPATARPAENSLHASNAHGRRQCRSLTPEPAFRNRQPLAKNTARYCPASPRLGCSPLLLAISLAALAIAGLTAQGRGLWPAAGV